MLKNKVITQSIHVYVGKPKHKYVNESPYNKKIDYLK